MGDLGVFFNGPWGGLTVAFAVALLMITRRIVWYTDLRREINRADKWEAIAIDQMRVNKNLVVQAEAANEIISKFPIPDGSRE